MEVPKVLIHVSELLKNLEVQSVDIKEGWAEAWLNGFYSSNVTGTGCGGS